MRFLLIFGFIFLFSISAFADVTSNPNKSFAIYPPMATAFTYSGGMADVVLGSYGSEINRRVKLNWDKPKNAASGEIVLNFIVLKDGTVKNIEIVQSSGNDSLDKSCMLAVELAQPFRPLPVGYKGSSLEIQLTFEAGINKPLKYLKN